MLKKLSTKLNINIESMLSYGSLAVITMLLIIYFWGFKNSMLVFPLTLTSIAMSNQNIYVKTFSKTIKLIITDCTIILVAFFSSYNPYIGIVINFFAILLICYLLTVSYNPKIYKPFIMLYVFSCFLERDIPSLLSRIYSVVFGIVLVVIFQLCFQRFRKIRFLNDVVNNSVFILNSQIEKIFTNSYDENLFLKHSKDMRNVCYALHISTYKKYLTTNLGKIIFNLFISLETINLKLRNLTSQDEMFLKDLSLILQVISSYSKKKIDKDSLDKEFNIIYNKYSNSHNDSIESILTCIKYIKDYLSEALAMHKKNYYKTSKDWEFTNLESSAAKLRLSFRPGTVRFNFAVRVATSLTLAIFLAFQFSVFKFVWVSITLLSILQPYYEDTLEFSKNRISGNILGVIICTFFLNISSSKVIPFTLLILALFLTYGFKKYYQISIATSMASLSSASLTTNINTLVSFRILYVLLGIALGYLANTFILPYKKERGLKHLLVKLLTNKKLMLHAIEENNISQLRYLIILNSLIIDNLISRNTCISSEDMNKLIYENIDFIVNTCSIFFKAA